ncbi:hypothetical protein ACHAWU_007340 [Discostella pseudostelligera]|uniref:Uncharacterized protein n=1 Tax=Discostella pseudostelligera TaxID=259834 RepID=A0ABD3LZ31_9STRA
MEYDDLPIAVATPIPLQPPAALATEAAPAPASSEKSPHKMDEDEEMPPPLSAASNTTTTAIDRSINMRDGSLSIAINTTTLLPNGHQERKTEYYRIPRKKAKEISAALDNGQMPAKSYMIRMKQQSLPPGMEELPPSRQTFVGTMRQQLHDRRHDYGRTFVCISLTLCIGMIILIVMVALFVTQPWNKVEYSSYSSTYDDITNNHEVTTPCPTASPAASWNYRY